MSRTGDGMYAGAIAPGWDIMGNADGGYLMAIAARAAAHAADRPDPVSVTAHFMRPAGPGPISISTEVLRKGRRFSVVRATMTSDATLLAVLGTFGTLETSDHMSRLESGPPTFPLRTSASRSSRPVPSRRR